MMRLYAFYMKFFFYYLSHTSLEKKNDNILVELLPTTYIKTTKKLIFNFKIKNNNFVINDRYGKSS